MGDIEKITFNGEDIYLKKGWVGWRVVEPVILKDADGKYDWNTWKWKNFFNKKGFITLGFLLILMSLFWLAYKEQINNYNEVMSNPCAYCKDCQVHSKALIADLNNFYEKKKQEEIQFNLTAWGT